MQPTRPVLTIFYHFDPWGRGIGGIDTLIRSQIKYAPREFDVRVVGAGGAGDKAGEWCHRDLHGREIRFLPLFIQQEANARRRVPNTLRYAFHLARRNPSRFDLASDFMHFHRVEPTLLARRWPGEKTLFIHLDIEQQLAVGVERNESRWRRFPAVYLALERASIGQFHQILSCNTSSIRFHQHLYPRLAGRFHFIRNCVDTEVHYPLDTAARERERQVLASNMGLHPDTRFILSAGRLEPVKDPLLLLRAFSQLNRPGTHLLIAGAGSMESVIRRQVSVLSLRARSTLLGALPPDRLANLQRVCSVLVLTSAYEGLPMVLLEALACGTPVVTTPSGECANVVGRGAGIVTRDCSEVSIVSALRRVLDDPREYPASTCTETASPFTASTVIRELFDEMLIRWRPRQC